MMRVRKVVRNIGYRVRELRSPRRSVSGAPPALAEEIGNMIAFRADSCG